MGDFEEFETKELSPKTRNDFRVLFISKVVPPLRQDRCHLDWRWHEVQHWVQTGHSEKGSAA